MVFVRIDLGVQSSLTMPVAGVLLLSTPHAVVAWGAERLRRPKANVENKSENTTYRDTSKNCNLGGGIV